MTATGGGATSAKGGSVSATGGAMATTGGRGMGKGGGGRSGTGGSGGASGTGGSSAKGGSSGASGTGGATAAGKSAGCGSTSAPKSGNFMLSVGGADRSYILKVPDDYKPDNPYRLMVAFHWLSGTAQNVSSENYYGLWSLSAGSTIFVAPQGNDNQWGDMGGEDIAFTKALVTDLKSKLCIDNGRVFAEGFSMGGSMSYAVACAMGDVFRAVAAHSGGPMSGCLRGHDKPVAYFMTHGTTDNVCTYPGFGVPQLEDFAEINGCMPKQMPTPSGNTQSCVDFEGCMPGYPARACIFVGGHTWNPSGNWVSGESWKFFSQF
jgi:poly(3-hydroxybutyrate) depolymerase